MFAGPQKRALVPALYFANVCDQVTEWKIKLVELEFHSLQSYDFSWGLRGKTSSIEPVKWSTFTGHECLDYLKKDKKRYTNSKYLHVLGSCDLNKALTALLHQFKTATFLQFVNVYI